MKVLIAVQKKAEDYLFDFISKYAWPPGSEFHVVHVVEVIPDLFSAHHISPDVMEKFMGYGQEVAADARKRLHQKLGRNTKVQLSTPIGSAANHILEIAKEWQADVMILGTRDRGVLGRLFLGSVSLSVVSQAPCAVFIIAPGHREHTKAA